MGNSNTVDSQTWRTLNAVNYKVQQEIVEQKQEQARIASLCHIGKKQQVEKDVLMPAALSGEAATSMKAQQSPTDEATTPRLPTPVDYALNADSGLSGKDVGLIAIIGAVLALQAKCNSNFWSTLWKQTSDSMMMQVQFAPIIANATKQAYNNQSDATQQQATQAGIDGAINIGMFALSCGMGVMMEVKSPESPFKTQNANFLNETEQTTQNAMSQATSTAERQSGQVVDRTIGAAQRDGESFPSRVWSKFKNFFNAAGKKQSGFTGFLGKLANASQATNQLSQGSTGLVNQHYTSIQASDQQAQGTQEALAKQSESEQQFYGQDFSRGTDLAQGCAQNLDYAMNIVKSISDTITQTVNSMFRG